MAGQKKSKKAKVSQTRRNKKTRRNVRKWKGKGGSMVLPLRSVIPFNNYDKGDVQREIINARNL